MESWNNHWRMLKYYFWNLLNEEITKNHLLIIPELIKKIQKLLSDFEPKMRFNICPGYSLYANTMDQSRLQHKPDLTHRECDKKPLTHPSTLIRDRDLTSAIIITLYCPSSQKWPMPCECKEEIIVSPVAIALTTRRNQRFSE